jgi:hypothetical protein
MSLGFWALYERRRFRWTRLEATQLVLGLSIPFLLTNHVIGTRVALSQFELEKGYAQQLVNFWVGSPLLGALQAVLLLIVWTHGCLGVHFWLRLKPFYPRVKGLRSGERRGSSRGAPQDAGLRSVDVGRGLRPRRLRSRRPARPRRRGARTRGKRESPERHAGGGFGAFDPSQSAGRLMTRSACRGRPPFSPPAVRCCRARATAAS